MSSNGCPLPDDWIRIAAWLYTDSSIGRDHHDVNFYQRKSKYKLITDILDNIGAEYRVHERDRGITHICGKKLLKPPEPEITISTLPAWSRRMYDLVGGDKNVIADWLWDLDDRQFEIFLRSFIDADGSVHPRSPTSLMIYCSREKMAGQIQALCLIHGYRATISEYGKNKYLRINIIKMEAASVVTHDVKQVHYTGKIWCVTVPSGNFLVRRGGRPIFTGNSRLMNQLHSPMFPSEITRLIDAQDWRIAPYYFSYLTSNGEKFVISHPKSAAKSSVETIAAKVQMHVIAGHSHLLRFGWDISGKFYAIMSGCCVDEFRLPYAAQRHTTSPAHHLGATIVRDGVPYLLHERVDWKRLESMK
jgi:hypothetical protein